MSGVVLEGITKRYGDVTAVDDLSLEAHDEEFLVLLPGAELDVAAELAGRLRATVADNLVAGEVSATISLGAAVSQIPRRPMKSVIQRAGSPCTGADWSSCCTARRTASAARRAWSCESRTR